MKREILFRGKRVDNGEWVEGFYVFRPDGKHLIYWKPFNEASQNTYHIVNHDTIGQFTGLTDKNGKQIFEGDVLNYKEFYNTGMDLSYEERELFTIEELKGEQRKETITPIEWIDAAFLIKTTRKEDDFDCMADILSGDQRHQQPITEAIVIGNIHDNPELS